MPPIELYINSGSFVSSRPSVSQYFSTTEIPSGRTIFAFTFSASAVPVFFTLNSYVITWLAFVSVSALLLKLASSTAPSPVDNVTGVASAVSVGVAWSCSASATAYFAKFALSKLANWFSAPVPSVYSTLYEDIAFTPYSRFSPKSTLYVKFSSCPCFTALFTSTKYTFEFSVISAFHPFSALFKSVVAFMFSL